MDLARLFAQTTCVIPNDNHNHNDTHQRRHKQPAISTTYFVLVYFYLITLTIILSQLWPQPVECLFWSRWRQRRETERKQRMNDIMVGLTLGVLSNAISYQKHQTSPLLSPVSSMMAAGGSSAGAQDSLASLASLVGGGASADPTSSLFMKRSADFDIEDSYESSSASDRDGSPRPSMFSLFSWPKLLRRRFGRLLSRGENDSDEASNLNNTNNDDSEAKQIEKIKEIITRWDERQSKVGSSTRPIIAVNGNGYTIDEDNELSLLRRMGGKRR